MKISCEKAVLQEGLSNTIRAVAVKSPIPAMEGFLFKAGESLEITCYNSELGIRTALGASIQAQGSLVLPAKLTLDIVRSLPDDIVTIESDDHFMTTLSCGASVFNIIGLNPQDFPELPVLLEEYSVSLRAGTLRSMINGVLFAASDNDNNPVLTGCKLEFSQNLLTIVALDYFRMAIRREPIERESYEELSFVVPAKSLRELERFLSDEEETLKIAVSRKNIAFSIGNIVLTSQLLEGEYMKYRNVIPKSTGISIKIATDSFLKSLERTSIIISETLKNNTVFMFDGNVARISCNTAVGRAYDECPIETLAGDPLRISFNSRYLIDALRACRDDSALLGLNSDLAPCVITPTEGDRYLYFIMPVRLKDSV
ncbi:MAG: DNA polymerase III subunit beta [Clostridiaceae bacterium]|nr:DNA polymerase III subunit beta [Clostridiaceae bacterium]